MRTTRNLEEDALLVAQQDAAGRERVSLGTAASRPVQRDAPAHAEPGPVPAPAPQGRFALLAERHEVITADQVRELIERDVL